MIRFLFLLLLLPAIGCSPYAGRLPDPAVAGFRTVEGVPFRPQEIRDDCGPAALASLLAHRGHDKEVAEIREAVYSPALGGTLLPDLENYARNLGFQTRSGRGDLDLLRASVDAGRPVIIPIQAGSRLLSRPHYLVVYGYDSERFLVHAGVEDSLLITSAQLLPRWEKMSRLYLLLD